MFFSSSLYTPYKVNLIYLNIYIYLSIYLSYFSLYVPIFVVEEPTDIFFPSIPKHVIVIISTRIYSYTEMIYIYDTHRLNTLEAENQHLREMLLEDKDKGADLGVPSFRTTTGENDNGETAFVEVSARGTEDPEEDPTIQCQTVCQFVRPNAMPAVEEEKEPVSAEEGGGLTAEEAELLGEGTTRR